MELIARRFDLQSGSARRAPPPRAGSHLATVTTTEPAIQSKPVDLRQRRDLLKIVEKARQMAADGQGHQSRYLGPVAPDAGRPAAVFLLATDRQAARPSGWQCPEPLGQRRIGGAAAGRPRSRNVGARGAGGVDFARPGDVAELVRRHADEQAIDGQRGNGRGGRTGQPVSGFATCRRDCHGRKGVSRTGVPAGLAARTATRPARGLRKPTGPLPARVHRLPVLRCRWAVAAGRLQDESGDGRHVAGGGCGVRNADARLRAGGRADPETPAGRIGALFSSSRAGIPLSSGTRLPASA